MKKLLLFAFCVASMLSLNAKDKETMAEFYGVWANDNCELVQTGKYTLVFRNNGDSITTYLRQLMKVGKKDKSMFMRGYNFNASANSCNAMECPKNLLEITMNKIMKLKDGKLLYTMNGVTDTLQLVERITLSGPAELESANNDNIGKCLQQWSLGTSEYDLSDKNFYIKIGTNRHSFMMYSTPEMVYWRAARIHSTNNGSVFAQNIRLMHNGEETVAYMSNNNKMEVSSPIYVNPAKFRPDTYSVEPDGIYWSYTSCTPSVIQLNGKGSAYRFERPQRDDRQRAEWFSFDEY